MNSSLQNTRKLKLTVLEMTVFSMLGAIMFLSKFIMQAIPNVHLLALFIAAFTLTYRMKALVPIYVFVLIEGVAAGFSLWWIPYLYIWLPLWGGVMLLSGLKMPLKVRTPVYMILCGLHGLSFGIMYAPMQALMFGLSFRGMIAWIIAGFPFDIVHCIGNLCSSSLVIPLYKLLKSRNIT